MAYHFIGVGGIGMSALARILLQRGCQVSGSDLKKSRLLEQLAREGAVIQIGHNESAIRPGDTVVFNSDIPPDNAEMKRARELNLVIMHRSDLLHDLMKEQKSLLVTGTHGKTTTTALLTAVLIEWESDPSFVIGGILRSLNTNARSGMGRYFVAEADESDGSFLKTPAYGAIVTNLEKEHLSYWKTEKNLAYGFSCFLSQVQNQSHLVWCGDDPSLQSLRPAGISYGFSKSVQCQILKYTPVRNGIRFDLCWQGITYRDIELALYGQHNALNGTAVFALAHSLGVPEEIIRRAFHRFAGTARRLEWIGSVQHIDVFDDYGHHPTEIARTIKALRDRVRERRIIVVFLHAST
jgi:UDP-N-acetylmuramate--alanine ligase